MGCIRPATPGFLCTLVATILLAIVSFCVPYFKSVFFLKAAITEGGFSGSVTFGTLGFCLELSNGTTCSKPSVGYELDINSLVDLPVEIPQVAVKWITYTLVLHIVALALAAGSAVFGLLAHVREMSMTCCSTCVSGFAAAVALLAFIFDIVLFFVAKSRINSVGSASMGNAIWLTLAAWVLLFFSGCFYTLGRCCISGRGPRNRKWDKNHEVAPNSGYDNIGEQMRMDAVKAEADRKARQKEGGLPAFHETQPLTARVDGDNVYAEPYHDSTAAAVPSGGYGRRPSQGASGYAGGGYVRAPAGSRAVDEYYNPSQDAHSVSSYPPQPQRQASSHTYAPSTYAPSTYTTSRVTASPPPNNQYLSANQITAQGYGHTAGGTTYHSAHDQYPSSYSQYEAPRTDPYASAQQTSYYGAQASSSNDRNYTLGGDGYGNNSVPPLRERSGSVPALPDHPSTSGYVPYSSGTPAPIKTNVPAMPVPVTSPISGPRPQPQRVTSPQHYEDSPPEYDVGTSNVEGSWGKAA